MVDEKVKLTATEARGGSRGKQVRTVLIVSICLVVIAFVAVYVANL